MRLIFLYTADGPATTGTMPKWNIEAPTTNRFALDIETEGYFCMLRDMVRAHIVDEVLIVIESVHGPGVRHFEPGLSLLVMPEINALDSMLVPSDVIWCRHGFRTWFPFLERCKAAGHWMLLYGANGGRERWRVWDVIMDDLQGFDNVDDWGRVHFNFHKPVNTDIFNVRGQTERKYDIMIGASHIHDKKGQWKTVQALVAWKTMFKKLPVCIMPGRSYRGDKTNEMYRMMDKHRLGIVEPGMVSRQELADLMRQTRVFVHMGSGQGDRGAIEAGCCGCYLVIGQPQYHHNIITEKSYACWTEASGDDCKELAKDLHDILGCMGDFQSLQAGNISEYYTKHFGHEAYTGRRVQRLFEFIKSNKPDNLKELIGYIHG